MFQLLSNTDGQNLPTFIASATTQNTSGGNTLVINKPTGTQDGDLMIAFMSSSSTDSTWTGATGWTEVIDQGSTPNLRIAYKIASSEGSSYTFTLSSNSTLSGSILTYRTTSYDAIGSITTGANPLIVTSVSASTTNCMLLGFVTRSTASLTITAPGSMTTRVTDNDGTSPSYCIAEEQLTSSGASGTRTFSGLSGSANTAGILLTIKPA